MPASGSTFFSFDDQVVLITGSGRGLGLAAARAFAQHGAVVYLNGRDAGRTAQSAAALAAETGGRVRALPFDVADEAAVGPAFATLAAETAGRLDVLVNNVGVRDRRGLFGPDLAAVRRLLEANLLAPFNLCRQAARLMGAGPDETSAPDPAHDAATAPAAAGGRIVNVTSIAGPIAAAGDAAYIAAKGGLAALTRALAAELGPAGIRVNAVAPGFFATETNADLTADPDLAAWLRRRTSLGRWGQPHEIAGAILFLASPAASYVTGHVLAVDGGYLAHF